jgi:hypothetical protein
MTITEKSRWVDDEGDEVEVVFIGVESGKVYYRYPDLDGVSVGDFYMLGVDFAKSFKPKETINDDRHHG